jgi:threonine/homoserine/homoserine lactone efflux protein
VLSVFGGLYLLWLSQKMFRVQNISISSKLGSDASLWTAVKVNILNPGPYLFWGMRTKRTKFQMRQGTLGGIGSMVLMCRVLDV